ncbi:MAG: AbrB/MazE/SpoVT family DNA-binding domain-containing protein [Bryobacteraceae bacterium]|jgi:bifunctional DNA-binding transcriptional regulator/antitoxin component of YhaV-PrlF toxin-antitoxin module
MAKVTSKYQVTVPRAIADRYGILPGDQIEWAPAGDVIRVVPAGKKTKSDDRDSKLRIFDQATKRYRKRSPASGARRSQDRGWKREELYGRGRSS